MGKATASFSTATFPYTDPLVVSDVVSRGGILASGEGACLRGQLLELAAGKWKKNVTATAGTPVGILADDADSTGGDASCVVYVGGVFMSSGIIWGSMAHDVATELLRDRGIQLESVLVGTGATVKGVPLATERIRPDDTAITKDLNPDEITTDQGPVPVKEGEPDTTDHDFSFEPHPSPLRVPPGQDKAPEDKEAVHKGEKPKQQHPTHNLQPPIKPEQKK